MTPETINWAEIAGWAGGVGTVLATVVTAVILGVRSALRIAKDLPAQPAPVTRTDVYTTDSLAMDKLTAALADATKQQGNTSLLLKDYLETSKKANDLIHEGNVLRREATTERRSLREALDKNTEATERSLQVNDNLRDEVRDLIRELVKRPVRRT